MGFKISACKISHFAIEISHCLSNNSNCNGFLALIKNKGQISLRHASKLSDSLNKFYASFSIHDPRFLLTYWK